ncbi:MAG: HlyD family efflux transporter periplasmic adaptor subunit [Verrucomicrobiales bacterium]|nr:HlyD family efflux transporter periplasmic adaptor subunit [Verrucomicrobiales bacterium]
MVEAAIFTDTVKRGEMLREVRGNGSLVPEEIRWVTATTPGRVEQILLLPGVTVKADTILVELSNPELEQTAFEVESQWHATEAQLERLKVQLESERLTQQSLIASLKSDLIQAKLEAEADANLLRDDLVPELAAKRSQARADELVARHELENARLEIAAKSRQAQVRVQEAEVEKLRKQYQLKLRQVEALKVRAGIDGVLQRIGNERALQVGQQIGAGASIALVANPAKLKAEIKIAETQARDVQHGQVAMIDTRNGVIPGRVVRIDPGVQNSTVTVDVELEGPLPKGARPDLSVDGTVTLERLNDVAYVGRPVNGQPDSLVKLFRVVEGGKIANRVQVKLGRSSVSSIEVIEGLEVGDQIILSDMSQWDSHEQVRLK